LPAVYFQNIRIYLDKKNHKKLLPPFIFNGIIRVTAQSRVELRLSLMQYCSKLKRLITRAYDPQHYKGGPNNVCKKLSLLADFGWRFLVPER